MLTIQLCAPALVGPAGVGPHLAVPSSAVAASAGALSLQQPPARIGLSQLVAGAPRISVGVSMMAVASPPPRARSSPGVTRRSGRGGQLISWYFNSISSTRLLTAQQEQQLAGMIVAGDAYEKMRDELEEELGRRPSMDEWAAAADLDRRELRKRMRRANSARDLMVAANMRLVVSIVRPYLAPNSVAGGALSMEDLVQEGSLGLLKAVSRFNPERGHRFSTYATWWIRTTVQRAVADQARTIRLPFGKSRMLSKAKRTFDAFTEERGRKPTEEELAGELDVSLAQLRVLMQHWNGVGSLEAPITSRGPSSGQPSGRTSTLLEAYRSRPQQQRTPEDSVEVSLVSDCLKEMLSHELSPLEAQVLSLRYGLEDGAALSWKQIAAVCEMPEKQLQLAQSRALRKLRKQRALRQLQPFCDHEDWENDPLGTMAPGERIGVR